MQIRFKLEKPSNKVTIKLYKPHFGNYAFKILQVKTECNKLMFFFFTKKAPLCWRSNKHQKVVRVVQKKKKIYEDKKT